MKSNLRTFCKKDRSGHMKFCCADETVHELLKTVENLRGTHINLYPIYISSAFKYTGKETKGSPQRQDNARQKVSPSTPDLLHHLEAPRELQMAFIPGRHEQAPASHPRSQSGPVLAHHRRKADRVRHRSRFVRRRLRIPKHQNIALAAVREHAGPQWRCQ